jgi:cytochrome P450
VDEDAISMKTSQAQLAEAIVPPGPTERFHSSGDFFSWLGENIAAYGGLYKAFVHGIPVYVVSAPEYVEHILRTRWTNYLRKGLVVRRISLALGNNLITSNGESWLTHRRMIQAAFTKPAIARFSDRMAAVNAELLEEWTRAAERRKSVNVTRDVSRAVLKITLQSIFGADYETVASEFRVFVDDAARDLRFVEALRPLRERVLQIVSRRREENRLGHDILGITMQGRDRTSGEPMPDAELGQEILNLVVAGHETTASLINWMWFLLAAHPEVQTKLGQEVDSGGCEEHPTIETFPDYVYTRQVIDEALRLYPPLWLMSRKAKEDDYLGEYFVPAGTEIYISPYFIQRNPQLWDTPDRFDPDRMSTGNKPDRPELAFCPFGAGPRKCIGDFFARVEIQMHLMMMARRLRFAACETIRPEFAIGLNLLSKQDFVMLPEMRTRRKKAVPPEQIRAVGCPGRG